MFGPVLFVASPQRFRSSGAVGGLFALFAACGLAFASEPRDVPGAPSPSDSPLAITGPAVPCHPCASDGLRGSPRPIDTVWRMSTRCQGWPSCGQTPRPIIHRFIGGHWHDATLSDYFATVRPGATTVVYIHGNDVEAWESDDLGWNAYAAIACGARDDHPIHFVIWSWPSNRENGRLRDIRDHAVRTAADGYYLGWVLAQLPPDAEIGLIGFSYGGRIVTGALEYLGGGEVAGQQLSSEPVSTHNVRAVLQSPAVDVTWIMSGGCHQNFAARVDSLLVQYNPCDPALQRFRWSDKCSRPTALGYVGIGVYRPSAERSEEIREEDVSGLIGRSHRSRDYLDSPELMRRARAALLPAGD